MDLLCFCSVLCLLCLCARLFICAFCMQFPALCQSHGKFSYIFIIFFIFIFLLEAKCFQLDSNFITINLRKNGFETFFHISHISIYNWPPSWTPSWIYRNAQ